MIQAVIFDLDDTLVQTETLKALSYARAAVELRPHDLKESGVVEAFKDVVGRSREEVAQTLMERFGLEEPARARMSGSEAGAPWEVFARIRLRYYEMMLADDQLLLLLQLPHNVALLHSVRQSGYKTALASMSHAEQVRRVLTVLGLTDAFDVIVTREDVRRGKPDPEIYLLAGRKLRCSPEECLVIEDSPVGVRAALAAGMDVIAVTTPFTREQFTAQDFLDRRWVVDDPETLPGVFRQRIDIRADRHRSTGSFGIHTGGAP